MPQFSTFSKLIHARFLELSKHELFVTVDGHELSEAYLAAFPEGTNPIYKTNTEHDCTCCKNFIRNIGNVVAIINGKAESVWNVKGAEYPYSEVAKALDALVVGHPITSLFRTQEGTYGAEETKQLQEDGLVKKWKHFHGKVASKHQSTKAGEVCGSYATTVQVFQRGLEELLPQALTDVLDLIASNSLYRGEEHKAAIVAFQKAQKAYLALKDEASKNVFAWANADSPASRFRNTVIGTLVQDLSSGVPLEAAVRSFEAKVAPANYKRPTALITPRMVEDAMKTIKELDLETALERRFATISDVNVNNVLWVDNSVKGKMKGGIADVLMASAKTTIKVDQAEDISIDDFMKGVVPNAVSMELLVKNAHQSNFMSLTAPVHESEDKLFKWANDFAWSYNGNIADSEIRKAVQGRGGRVDGVFRFSHSWNYDKRNASLMDLHVFMPGSTISEGNPVNDIYGNSKRVGWNNRSDMASGGVQDVDYVQPAPVGYVPVENITFPDLARMPEGDYICKVHNWSNRPPTEAGFKAEIEFAGQVFEYEYIKPLKQKEWVTVATVNLKKGVFTIKHHLPCSVSSQNVWGINTEQFVKVNTLMFSPNFWDDNTVGNKHHFFILEGCKNPEPTRGIYNEFLNSNLEKHRKVFEILGDKTKCQPIEDQLSGLGFSSTRGDTVTVKVQGTKINKTFNVKF